MLKIRCITIKKAAKGSLFKGKASCLYITGGVKSLLASSFLKYSFFQMTYPNKQVKERLFLLGKPIHAGKISWTQSYKIPDVQPVCPNEAPLPRIWMAPNHPPGIP